MCDEERLHGLAGPRGLKGSIRRRATWMSDVHLAWQLSPEVRAYGDPVRASDADAPAHHENPHMAPLIAVAASCAGAWGARARTMPSGSRSRPGALRSVGVDASRLACTRRGTPGAG